MQQAARYSILQPLFAFKVISLERRRALACRHSGIATSVMTSASKSTVNSGQSASQETPSKEAGPSSSKKEAPDFGWTGPVPSHEGGDKEENFMNKPPYTWTSNKFRASFRSQCFCGNVAFEFAGEPYTFVFSYIFVTHTAE